MKNFCLPLHGDAWWQQEDTNVHVFNVTELYTQKWLQWSMLGYYVYVIIHTYMCMDTPKSAEGGAVKGDGVKVMGRSKETQL